MNNKLSVAVIDYGTGNIASLLAALRIAGAKPFVATSSNQICSASALVLPGVGHFSTAIKSLNNSGLLSSIIDSINKGMPTLGICLGFQLLTLGSDEAPGIKGLGLLPFNTNRMNPKDKYNYKIPHIGWNNIDQVNGELKLLDKIYKDNQLFYYSNAYAVSSSIVPNYPHAIYKHDTGCIALIEKDNIYGVQFHPEKSRHQGNIILKNFLSLINY
tara:strand:+ start:125 stop:769 length:645 start_codon:yes stop_codon:yes gene_type:complete